MGIKQDAEKIFKVKNIKGEYVTNNNGIRKYQILEEWIEKQETLEERQDRLKKLNIFEINDTIENIDKKFCINIEKFVNNYMSATISPIERLKVAKIGKDIVCNFIIERSSFIIRSNAIYVLNCKNEGDVQRWFEENCNNICLEIPLGKRRHLKIKGDDKYRKIDYSCSFIGGATDIHYIYCEDNGYCPFLKKYMNEAQKKLYRNFYELIDAKSILIEIEYVSSNFVRYKHPSTTNMVICYEIDKEIGIPTLSINPRPLENKYVK